MGWDPMQKIGLHDKPMKWFPGVNSVTTSGNNMGAVLLKIHVTKYNNVIII
jgi:hypothetical protein